MKSSGELKELSFLSICRIIFIQSINWMQKNVPYLDNERLF